MHPRDPKIKKSRCGLQRQFKRRKKPKGTGIINKNMSSFAFSIDKNKTPDKIELSYEAIGNMVLTKRAKIELLGR